MPFDPNQPFEVVGGETPKPAFDPSQPFEAAAETPPAAPAAAPTTPPDKESTLSLSDLVTGNRPNAKPEFDPAKPFEPVDTDFWHQTANAAREMEAHLAKFYAGAEAIGKNILGNLSDQFLGTNIGTPERKPNVEKDLQNYDAQLAVKQQMLAALPPGHPDTERLSNEVAGLKADRGNFETQRNTKADIFQNAVADLHNTLANIDPQFAVDPALKGTLPAKLGGAVGDIAPAFTPGIGAGVLMVQSGINAWAEKYDETGGDTAAADAALVKSTGTNLAFLGAAHGANSVLGKAIELVPGASKLQSFFVRAAGGSAANVAIGQGLAGAEAAAGAPPGERFQKFAEAFNTPDGTNIAQGIAFGLLGTKPIESLKAAAREYVTARTADLATAPPELQQADAAASRARTIAPRTAEAAKAVVDTALADRNAAVPPVEAPRAIAGPVLTDAANNVLAEGKIGATHASLTSEALPKYLEANPEADPNSMQHQFRDTKGNVISRTAAWELAKASGQIKPEVLAAKEASAAKDGKPPELHSQDLQGAPETPAPVPGLTLTSRPVTPTEQANEMYGDFQFTHVEEVKNAQGDTIGKVRGDAKPGSFEIQGANVDKQLQGTGVFQTVLRQLADKYGKVVYRERPLDNPATLAAFKKAGGVAQPDGAYVLTAPTPPESRQNTPADVRKGLQGIARGISASFYDAAFKSLTEGKTTISGVADPILAKAKPFYDAGLINSPEEFKSLVQSGDINKPPTALPPTEPKFVGKAEAPTPPLSAAELARIDELYLKEAEGTLTPNEDAELSDLLIGPEPPAKTVPPVIPAAPLPEPAPPPTPREVAQANARTPAERAAKIESGTTAAREQAARTGLVPTHAELQASLGDSAAAKTLRAELEAKQAADHPPEALPAGATEIQTKNPLTGDQLPSINEGGKLRPRFTNDPNLTAQQIDTGAAGTDKANRLYVPDEIMDADQLNPAIDTAYDKDAQKFYVTAVNSEFGRIEKPDDFAVPYREAKAQQKAHQLVSVGNAEELQRVADQVRPEDNSIGQALTENGFAPDVVRFEPEATDVPEGAVATAGDGAPTVAQARETVSALKRVRILGPDGKAAPDAVINMLQAIANKELPAFAWMRIMAKTLLKSGVDLSKVQVEVVNRPNANYAGLYQPNATDVSSGKLTFNIGVGHQGGVLGTAFHELFHHATLVKVDPNYKRTPTEQRAYETLQKLFDHATQEVYKLNNGREATPEELDKFRAAQATKGPESNRNYYGLVNLREFVSEALSNPRFMKVLQQLNAAPGIKVSGKIRDLLVAVREALKTLFTGSASRNSTLDQVLDQSLQFIEAGAVEHARAGEVPFVTAAAAKKAAPVVVDGPGWVLPDGQFVKAEESSPIGQPFEATGAFGEHEQAALDYLQKNKPELFAKLEQQTGAEPPDAAVVNQFMEQNGFVRVTGGGPGGTIYITGQPSRAQRQLLTDNAIEQKATLVHDFGGRSRTLFSPGEAFAPPAGEPSPTAPKIVPTETGHTVEIPPDATRTELQETIQALDDPANGIAEADKARIKDELTDALGPTITLTKGKATDRIVYGYDAVQNIANRYGKEQANSVALDFGAAKNPTPEQLQDRAAAPFVIEAGGDKEELVRDLMQVIHSKDPKLAEQYAPIVQHAIDNFDRLNEITQHSREVTQKQLERERAAGVSTGQVDNYVTRLLDQPDSPDTILPGAGGAGSSRYFMKGRKFEKLADAIKEGFIPKTTDIVDLTQRRIEAGERLVQQRLLEQELRSIKGPDGRPIIGDTEEYESITGNKETSVPRGYVTVQTGGRPIVVNQQFAKVFQALYGDSTINQFVKDAAGFLKQYTLVFDTYHVGRIMFKELAYSKGAERFGHNKGLSILEYAPEDIDRAVKSGDISQRMADYTKEVMPSGLTRRAVVEELLKRGLNVGRVSDNLITEHAASLPYVKNFNPWVFQKLSRGAMIQTAMENFQRNMTRFPERGIEGNARQTAKESNEVFGNLQNQGLFTNKSYQDLARVLVLAPNWAESQLKAELRGYGQIGRAAGEAATGKFRLGTTAQGQLTVVLGMLAANQIANFLTTSTRDKDGTWHPGHSTFQNKDGHLLDAFIPGGARGFWFSPLEIGAEYAHMASRYFSQHQTPIDVLTRIASNKLGNVARSLTTLATGRDFAGRSFSSLGDRIRGALADLLPIPIGLSGALEKDPRQTFGLRANRQAGATEKQLLQSVGLKVTPVMSPTSEMFALAYPYRSDRSYQGPVEYKDLRAALDNADEGSVQKELALLSSRGKTTNQIQSAIGVGDTQKFTDSTVREVAFVRSLTPEQKKIYTEAQHEHAAHTKLLMRSLRAAPAEVKSKLRLNIHPELPLPKPK